MIQMIIIVLMISDDNDDDTNAEDNDDDDDAIDNKHKRRWVPSRFSLIQRLASPQLLPRVCCLPTCITLQLTQWPLTFHHTREQT